MHESSHLTGCCRAALEAQLAGMQSKLLQGEAQGGLHVLARRQEDLLRAQQQELQQRRDKVWIQAGPSLTCALAAWLHKICSVLHACVQLPITCFDFVFLSYSILALHLCFT